MNQKNHYSRKKRQLSVLAKRLQYLISNYHVDISNEIEKIIYKIKRIINELARVISKPSLTKILGATAFIFGITSANQSSAQSFSTPQTNPFNIISTYQFASPTFVDLDNDGDLDLLAGEYYGALKYFKNTGTNTNPSFATPVTNPFGLDSTVTISFPNFVDIDNDGDMDLFVGEYPGNIVYFKNIGTATNPQFASPQTNPFGLTSIGYFSLPTFADIDGDGDMDLLTGGYYGSLHYFQNTGSATNPHFTTEQINPFGLDSTYIIAAPAFADLDKDGDLDLLVGEYYGAMQYYKNIGTSTNPQFASPQNNPFGIDSVIGYAFPTFADIDNDGDMDLFVGEYYGNIIYFENGPNSIRNTKQNISDKFKIYPNPATNVISIDTKEKFDQIEIFNSLGESVLIFHSIGNKIPIDKLSPGIYTIEFRSNNGLFAIKKLIKQ